MTDKDTRTELHMAIRNHFKNMLHSDFDPPQESIIITASRQQRSKRSHDGDGQSLRGGKRRRGGNDRRDGEEPARSNGNHLDGQYDGVDDDGTEPSDKRPGEGKMAKRDTDPTSRSKYLHFIVLKVNRETMDVANFLRKHTPASVEFRNAGTKDRRGVTVQRFSVCNSSANALTNLARKAQGWTLGNFTPASAQLKLGELQGNEFQIVLRDVRLTGETTARWGSTSDTTSKLIERAAKEAADSITNRGFINYFGLQRFGTGKVHTHTTGVHMLQGNFDLAVDTILSFDPELVAAYHDSKLRERNKMDLVECKRALRYSCSKAVLSTSH